MTKRIYEPLISVLFGEWNGIQIFLLPTTLFYLLDGFSVARWVSGLLTVNIHYLPLTVFLFLALYIGFITVKRISMDDPLPSRFRDIRSRISFIIEMHRYLIVLFFVLTMVFMLSSFLRYFYNISFPIRYVFSFITQVFCMVLIIYQYLIYSWLNVFLARGYSNKRAWAALLIYTRDNVRAFIVYSLLILLAIIVSVYVYSSVISYLFSPALYYLSSLISTSLELSVKQGSGNLLTVINVSSIFVAFLISNLLFSPIVKITHAFLQKHHPLSDYRIGLKPQRGVYAKD